MDLKESAEQQTESKCSQYNRFRWIKSW